MGLRCSKAEVIAEDKAVIATRDLVNLLLKVRFAEANKIIAELKETKNEIDDSSYNALDWDLSALLSLTCEKIDKLELTIIKFRSSLIDLYRVLDRNIKSETF